MVMAGVGQIAFVVRQISARLFKVNVKLLIPQPGDEPLGSG